MGSADEDAELAGIWEEFRGETAARLAALEAATRAALAGTLGAEQRASASFEAHTLAGSAGVFGFTEAGRLAKEIDELVGGSGPIDPAAVLHLAELCVSLRSALDARDEAPPRPPGPAVLIFEPDAAMRTRLEAEARADELRPVATGEDLDRADVDVAVISLRADPAFERIRALTARRIPVVVRGAGDPLAERASVAGMAGAVYVPAEADAALTMSAAVDAVARGRRVEGADILIVDDDRQVVAAAAALLAAHGAAVRAVSDPAAFWAAMEERTPQLVLLDVEMGDGDGIELCRQLRADARWVGTLVMFLTSHVDPASVRRMWSAGGDDYVTKPFRGADLVARVSARLATRETAAEPVAPAGLVDVVVVDDDAALGRLLVEALEQRGHRAIRIDDGAVALERLAGEVPQLRPRVILLDVGLPSIDGFAVLARLAADEVTSRTRVIMLTARASEREVLRALELGAFDHVAKPFSVAVLLQRVRRAMEGSR